MFNIILYNTPSEPNVINKTLNNATTLSGTLVVNSPEDICSPVFDIVDTVNFEYTFNYLYCSEFGRYYFIEKIESISNNIVRLHCAIDVLMTYKTEIGNLTATLGKTSDMRYWNTYLNDNAIKAQQNINMYIRAFDYTFKPDASIVLCTSGGVEGELITDPIRG